MAPPSSAPTESAFATVVLSDFRSLTKTALAPATAGLPPSLRVLFAHLLQRVGALHLRTVGTHSMLRSGAHGARAHSAADGPSSATVAPPPSSDQVGGVVSGTRTVTIPGGGSGVASVKEGGYADRCPSADGTVHATYTMHQTMSGGEGATRASFEWSATATITGHVGPDGAVTSFDLDLHYQLLTREQDGATVTNYAHASGAINETVTGGTRGSVGGSLSNHGISQGAGQDVARISLEHAEEEASQLFTQGTALCNHFTLTLDSDVTDAPDAYNGSYDMHIVTTPADLAMKFGDSGPVEGFGSLNYSNVSGSAVGDPDFQCAADLHHVDETDFTIGAGQNGTFDVEALHFDDAGGYPGKAITVQLDVALSTAPTELLTSVADPGGACQTTLSARAPRWLSGFTELHADGARSDGSLVLNLQPGGGGSDFADATYTGTVDDGNDAWSETTTLKIVHTPQAQAAS